MDFFDFSFWQSFLSNMGATIIGVGLGIPAALWINRQIEGKTEKERKKKLLSIIKVELGENQFVLNDWIEQGKPKTNILQLTAMLKDESWSAFSNGGELQWIKDPKLLAELSDRFSTIHSIKYVADQYFKLIQFPTKETSVIATSNVWSLLNGSIIYFLKSIPELLKEIDNSINS